jgi:hypothetical protein
MTTKKKPTGRPTRAEIDAHARTATKLIEENDRLLAMVGRLEGICKEYEANFEKFESIYDDLHAAHKDLIRTNETLLGDLEKLSGGKLLDIMIDRVHPRRLPDKPS